MARFWTKKQDKEERKDIPTADFKDFYADNVFKCKEENPQEIKIESK
ncbi:MAG: hypothetical protein Q4F34_05690 [Prevotellaceae bacterium]|nr:hypothetical protein [Prevotellaceae bacterium]